MMIEYVTQRLQHTALLPEFQHALQRMAAYDQSYAATSHWGSIIPAIQCVLGGAPEVIAPFAAAWSLMYAATIRLDHQQDGDPVDHPLPTVDRPSAQYNLIFGYYVFATGLLDLLSSDLIPAQRILHLRRFWTDTMLRMAGGQQQDLTTHPTDCVETPLNHYQQLAQAKTGAAYALAFGGTAILLNDDLRLIEALTVVGELYGTLIQYSDDLLDAAAQPNLTLTLPDALILARPAHVSDHTGHTPTAFGAYLYRTYYEQAALILAELQPAVQEGMLGLFRQTFDRHRVEA